jgi:hypothetical protein
LKAKGRIYSGGVFT